MTQPAEPFTPHFHGSFAHDHPGGDNPHGHGRSTFHRLKPILIFAAVALLLLLATLAP